MRFFPAGMLYFRSIEVMLNGTQFNSLSYLLFGLSLRLICCHNQTKKLMQVFRQYWISWKTLRINPLFAWRFSLLNHSIEVLLPLPCCQQPTLLCPLGGECWWNLLLQRFHCYPVFCKPRQLLLSVLMLHINIVCHNCIPWIVHDVGLLCCFLAHCKWS